MLNALIAAVPSVVTGLAFLLVLYSLLRRDLLRRNVGGGTADRPSRSRKRYERRERGG